MLEYSKWQQVRLLKDLIEYNFFGNSNGNKNYYDNTFEKIFKMSIDSSSQRIDRIQNILKIILAIKKVL